MDINGTFRAFRELVQLAQSIAVEQEGIGFLCGGLRIVNLQSSLVCIKHALQLHLNILGRGSTVHSCLNLEGHKIPFSEIYMIWQAALKARLKQRKAYKNGEVHAGSNMVTPNASSSKRVLSIDETFDLCELPNKRIRKG